MLTISRALHDKIVAHARADHPDEACGVIAGPAGSDRPERFIAMTNAERSPTFYRFDSAEQARDWLRALNDVRLMFGVRLEVTEDFEDQLTSLDPKDPRVAAFEVYGWLGAVQESLVRAITRLPPRVVSAPCLRSRAPWWTRSSNTPARTTRTRPAA